jgi:hypothetical protein
MHELVNYAEERRLSDEELDLIALERIDPFSFTLEPSLYNKKWWDYRRWHPTYATYEFALAYEKAYRLIYSQRYDLNEAKNLRVFKNRDPLDSLQEVVFGLWGARQHADLHGISYDFYCLQGLYFSEVADWSMLARPIDLTGMKVRLHITTAWNDLGLFRPSKSEYYKPENFVGDQYQMAYYRKLYHSIKAQNGRSGVNNAMSRGVLTSKILMAIEQIDAMPVALPILY